ncbi:MAG TPA: dipeptide ABC transporter ATP-binding protein [Firmicutes bacterium]|jgi:oligopeptide transport system ATP-binding protein|nr:dipeptide ABC transporter ATP-binding protein [Bacillota bacterium]HOQ25082.1 dipeptide ABC transporter ATP-binding protein [Bacillota bacterium]HPT68444.1 dipeptide ABC transporter ATP-binding protein [Bacillota bacterium]
MLALLEVENLKKHYPAQRWTGRGDGTVRAVDGVGFSLAKGETLGLVGESGCGKTTLGRMILRLLPVTAGTITFNGTAIEQLTGKALLPYRRKMQLIFQDPYASLNPRLRVGDALMEPLLIHSLVKNKQEARVRAGQLLEMVGLSPEHMRRYPHEFSGGQRQRIVVARALTLEPELIVCDEPVSALDVSIQAQIINMLMDLQKELGLTYIFIAHDLSVVKHISTRVAVMYLGKFMELAEKNELFSHPLHPYTRALLSAVPVPDPGQKRDRIILQGDLPSPMNPPAGCRFHTRCPQAMPRCAVEEPVLTEVSPSHAVACHLVDDRQ